MRVNSSMRIKLSNKLINVCSDVIMEPNIWLFLDFYFLKILTELSHSCLIFALLWSLNIFDDTSSEICTINFSFLVFKHQKLKSKKFFYDISSELNHIIQTKSIWMLFKNTVNAFVDRFFKILNFRLKLSGFKTYWLLYKSIVISTNFLNQICIT